MKHLNKKLSNIFVASTPELATNFIDYKQMAGMTTVRNFVIILFYHGVMR